MRGAAQCRRGRPIASGAHGSTAARAALVLVLPCIFLASAAVLARTPPAETDEPPGPPGPPRINDWVPLAWWWPVQFVSGRLDDDAFDDMAVVLERKLDAPEDEQYPRGSRALLVLFSDELGQWRRGPLVPDLLPCAECLNSLSGTRESEVFDLSIPSDGILEIGWLHKREDTVAVRLVIGWDAEHGALGLLADDVTRLRPDGRSRTRTRRDFRAGTLTVDGLTSSMPARFVPIEEVSAAQY